jgi:hypothetical protein
VSIPIGAANNLSNGSVVQGETFLPGSHAAVFSVTFSGANITWTLDGKSVIAESRNAYFERLPLSVIAAGITPDALAIANRDVDKLVETFAPNGVNEELLYEIVTDVLSHYPDLKTILGPTGSITPIMNDFPSVPQAKLEEKLFDILNTYTAAMRYEILAEIEERLNTPTGLAKTLASGTPNPDELKVMLKYPHLILSTKDAKEATDNWVNTEFAGHIDPNGNSSTPTVQNHNQPNAMRHSLWNALIVHYCGWAFFSKSSAIDYAERFTTAHETGAGPNTSDPYDAIGSKMDSHNNAAGRAYIQSVASIDVATSSPPWLTIIPYVVTPNETTIKDYLANKAKNLAQYADAEQKVDCVPATELVIVLAGNRTNSIDADCTTPQPIVEVTVEKPRVLARVISTIVTVVTPTPPCPSPIVNLSSLIACGVWHAAWKGVTNTVVEQTINLAIDYPNVTAILVSISTATPVITPQRLKCTDGTEVTFSHWEGDGANYLSNRYESSTTINIPSGAGNTTIRAVYQ